MATLRLDTLSPFGRLAVALDTDLSEMSRLSGQIERLEIDSEGGLEHAVKLLQEFAARAQASAEGIQEFSKALRDAHARSEAAAQKVAESAPLIQERRQRQFRVQEKLAQVKQDVKAVNDGVARFRKPGNGKLSEEEKSRIQAECERVGADLTRFITTSRQIKEEAAQAKFKSVERDAQALIDTLESSRRKINQALTGR